MSSAQNLGRSRRQRPNLKNFFFSFLDIVALGAWGVLLVKYWVSNQLSLLIHPNYFGLVVVTGFVLLMLAAVKLFQLFFQVRQRVSRNVSTTPVAQHVSLLPPGWSNALLLATAILGLSVQPKVFNSQTAIQRGVTESTILTRAQPQSFRSASKPEDRSLIDWVRTLNVYPEPDAYTGQAVKVKGFVVHPPDLASQYLLISRFVITCCAADAYPVGLPVKLAKLNKNRDAYPVDSWFEVKGQMITESLNGKRQLVIDASSLSKIPEPANPYYY
ncbi:MAG TPA: TIGR03943 family protein [Chroococcales cyanobacterium]